MAKKRSKKDRIRAKLRHVPVANTSVAEPKIQKMQLEKRKVNLI